MLAATFLRISIEVLSYSRGFYNRLYCGFSRHLHDFTESRGQETLRLAYAIYKVAWQKKILQEKKIVFFLNIQDICWTYFPTEWEEMREFRMLRLPACFTTWTMLKKYGGIDFRLKYVNNLIFSRSWVSQTQLKPAIVDDGSQNSLTISAEKNNLFFNIQQCTYAIRRFASQF